MIKEIRNKYNSEITDEIYNSFVKSLNYEAGYKIEFRIAETPIFLPKSFKYEVLKASENILSYLHSESFKITSQNAIPAGMAVPEEDFSHSI